MKANLPILLNSLRIRDWWHNWLGLSLLALRHLWPAPDPARVMSAFGFCGLYLAWGHAFNNLFDLEEDGSSAKNALHGMTPVASRAWVCALTFLLFAASFPLGLAQGTALLVVANAVYSIPPLRLKRCAVPSLCLNGLLFSFAYFAPASILAGGVSSRVWEFSGFVFLLFVPIQFVHWLEHQEEAGRSRTPLQRLALYLLFLLPGTVAIFFLSLPVALASLAFGVAAAPLADAAGGASQARRRVRLLGLAFGVILLVLGQSTL
jgi:4-hydroxybenzoate polyprenyltransferase